MKKTILVLAVALMANIAQAKVTCAVEKETVRGSGNYDRTIFMGEIEESALLAISADEKVTDLLGGITPEAFQANNGNLFFSVYVSEGRLSLGYGRVDTSKGQSVTPLSGYSSSVLSAEATFMKAEDAVIACKQ